MSRRISRLSLLLAAVVLLLAATTGLSFARPGAADRAPLGTGFTYQGQLTDGGDPADGLYDFRFDLYDAAADGTLLGTLDLDDVTVTNGLFTVSLDFGGGVFDGSARWLAIEVRPGAETGAYTPLNPRQALTAAPYAQFALEAGSVAWDNVSDNPIPTSCAAGEILAWDDTAGAWACTTDADTTYAAGFGLELDSGTFNVLTDTIQARVSGSCSVGSTIRAINADGSVVCQLDAPLNRSAPPADNIFSTVSTSAFSSSATPAVTIGSDGLPIISFFDQSVNNLMAAHCDDPACTSVTTNTVDDGGGNIVGIYSSIVIGADGLPVISYKDSTDLDLRVSHCDDLLCSSATSTTLDSAGDVGWYTSIAIGSDGLPIISYFEFASGTLKAAHCDDLACSSATLTTLDISTPCGFYTSIVIGADGLPVISYYQNSALDLKVAHCDDRECTSATLNTVDSVGQVGMYTSITIGVDGLPIISYYHGGDDNLKFAHCDDAVCSSAAIQVLDSAGDVGKYSSLTIGVDGLPLITYYDVTNGNLEVMQCANAFCVPYWGRR